MKNIYDINGLIFWNAEEIALRSQLQEAFARGLYSSLLAENPGWSIHQIEAPLLTPRSLLNVNYTAEDIWVQPLPEIVYEGLPWDGEESLAPGYHLSDLALRPETTPGSYAYAEHLLNTHSGVVPPFIVWQAGKSFRRENEQPTKFMRLKEFYQQEFQCFYARDTLNDYHSAVLEPVRRMIADQLALPTRIVPSDRLPAYSEVTMDIEVWCQEPPTAVDHLMAATPRTLQVSEDQAPDVPAMRGGRWMEVCSISRRTDFTGKARFQGKKGPVEKDLLVLEVAIGLDRCIYNILQRRA